MAVVNKIEKKTQMSRWDLVKYQILTHCYLNKEHISESELDCLTLLCLVGERELTEFCTLVQDKNIFKSTQAARNAITKLGKKDFIIKVGKNRKKVIFNPNIKVQSLGSILLDYKFIYIETV